MVAMELTNNSSLENFIGCSRTALRSMNSCYFFEDIENETKILYCFPPQSSFCDDEKNVVDFVDLHQMMSKCINCRGQLTDDGGIPLDV